MRKRILVVVVLLTATLSVLSHQMGIANDELELLAAQRKAVIAQVEEAKTLAVQLPELRRAVQALDVEPSRRAQTAGAVRLPGGGAEPGLASRGAQRRRRGARHARNGVR